MTVIRVLVIIIGLFTWTNIQAAELVKLKEGSPVDDVEYPPSAACNFVLSGLIRKNDLAKIQAIANPDEENPQFIVVCLDSPGGSLSEAIKIARYFKSNSISTKIDAGAICESSCAIIFMAGTHAVWDAGYYHWRVLHPLGRLGFHAPSLILEEGNYQADSVIKAYNIALKTISNAIDEINLLEGFDGGNSIEFSLLSQMLRTPGDSMFYIDTVDKAGRWNITVGPTEYDEPISDTNLAIACLNAENWTKAKSSEVAHQIANENRPYVETDTTDDNIVKTVITLEYTGEGCVFTFAKNAKKISQIDFVKIIYGDNLAASVLTFLKPSKSISVLVNR